MLASFYKLKCVIGKILSEERGASLIEYVGITAVALILVTAIVLYLQSDGMMVIGEVIAEALEEMVGRFRAIDQMRY